LWFVWFVYFVGEFEPKRRETRNETLVRYTVDVLRIVSAAAAN
jgi:hypothetical protein